MSVPFASTALGALVRCTRPISVQCGASPSVCTVARTALAHSSSNAAKPQPSVSSRISLACSTDFSEKSSRRTVAARSASRVIALCSALDKWVLDALPPVFLVCRVRAARMQDQLLHTPIEDFGDVEGILIRAGYAVHPAEFLELLAGTPEQPKHLAVKRELVDAAWKGVRDVKHLVRGRGDAQGPRRAGRLGATGLQIVGQVRLVADGRLGVRRRRNVDADCALIFAVDVEDLDAAVIAIGDIDCAARVGDNVMQRAELAFAIAGLAPRLQPVAVLVELGDARIDIAVADEDIAGRIPGDIGGLPEAAGLRWQRWFHVRPRSGLGVGCFLLAPDHHGYPPLRIEPDDHVGALVDGPDIVVLVDAHGVGERPGVQILADFAEIVAVGAELPQ